MTRSNLLFLTWWSVLASLVFGASCGDDGSSGVNPTDVCTTICEKEQSCDALGGATLEECVADCEEHAAYMLEDYLAATGPCMEEKTCEELLAGETSRDACYEENLDLCTTDTSGYVEAACLKLLECDGIDEPTEAELQECTDRMHADGNVLICFKPAKIGELRDCVENATFCNPNPVNTCAREVVGLDLGGSGR
jgi:hypothetical protein